MKRKVFIGLLALTLCVSVVACGKKADKSASDSSTEAISEDSSNVAAPDDIEPIDYVTSPNGIQLDEETTDYTEYEDAKTVKDVSSDEAVYNWTNKNKAVITENQVSESKNESILDDYDFVPTESESGVESEVYQATDNDSIVHQVIHDEVGDVSSIAIINTDGNIDFDYMGVTDESKISDIVNLFGEPMTISVIPDTQTTTYVYADETKNTTFVFMFVGADNETSRLTYMTVYNQN